MERMVAAGFDGRVRVESETVTAGITQQILGPVRARAAELRFSPGTARRAHREGWRALTKGTKGTVETKTTDATTKEDPSLPPARARGPRPPRAPAAAAAAAAAARNGGTGARDFGSTRRFGDAWRAARQEMAGAELVYGIDCPLPRARRRQAGGVVQRQQGRGAGGDASVRPVIVFFCDGFFFVTCDAT